MGDNQWYGAHFILLYISVVCHGGLYVVSKDPEAVHIKYKCLCYGGIMEIKHPATELLLSVDKDLWD